MKAKIMPHAVFTAFAALIAGAETDLARTFNLRGLPHHLHGSFSFLVKSE